MKTPSCWNSRNFISNVLLPLGWLYNFATKMNIRFKKPQKVSKKVICIGNLTAGGTGKTPVAISIASLLQNLGHHPFFVSRGYGGKLKNVLVDSQKHSASEVGDEPLLLSKQAPVIVNSDRYQGALKAIELGADTIVMDDGFQNPSLKKNLSFLVFDGGFGYGNGRGIPSGPLREELTAGLKRAQAIIIIGEDKYNLRQEFHFLPIFQGFITSKPTDLTNPKAIAFAGIGRPEKFYNSMRNLGFDLIETIDFPDHHKYDIKELDKLITRAQVQNALLYTTSKDYVKIPPVLQSKFNVLEIEVTWQDKTSLIDFLKKNI